jgi:hypothetical protein
VGITRTLGIVRFFNVNLLTVVHNKILSGPLLGKTLYDSNIDFDKEFIGSVKVNLPEGLRNDFKSEHDNGLIFQNSQIGIIKLQPCRIHILKIIKILKVLKENAL